MKATILQIKFNNVSSERSKRSNIYKICCVCEFFDSSTTFERNVIFNTDRTIDSMFVLLVSKQMENKIFDNLI